MANGEGPTILVNERAEMREPSKECTPCISALKTPRAWMLYCYATTCYSRYAPGRWGSAQLRISDADGSPLLKPKALIHSRIRRQHS